jgi:hypothetical protein
MLLNEMQKQVRENLRNDAQIAALRKQVESLQKETGRIEVSLRARALLSSGLTGHGQSA